MKKISKKCDTLQQTDDFYNDFNENIKFAQTQSIPIPDSEGTRFKHIIHIYYEEGDYVPVYGDENHERDMIVEEENVGDDDI